MTDQSARQYAMICHLSGLLGFAIPFGGLVAPLVLWTLKKDEHPFIDDQGREAINFQINVLIYTAIFIILIFLLIGIPLLILLGLAVLALAIIAAVKANSGEKYRYPMTFRFL